MIDLHSHILPGIDDGATDIEMSLEMARMFVADGVDVVACTPHILPGVYHNTGPQIRRESANLQAALDDAQIPLRLISGADIHVVPDFVAGLKSGHLLTLGDSRYVLVEPPHHIPPPRIENLFLNILAEGYIPILTHPERLSWIKTHYSMFQRLARAGVWMQITAGSLAGAFGQTAQYWAERMLDDGCVHILATDAHDTRRRPPVLSIGRDLAARRVGAREADDMVTTRTRGVLNNELPINLPMPSLAFASSRGGYDDSGISKGPNGGRTRAERGLAGRLRRLFR